MNEDEKNKTEKSGKPAAEKVIPAIPWEPHVMQRIYRSWAMLFMKQKEYAKAIPYLSKSIELDEKDILLYALRSQCYAYNANFDEALSDAIQANDLEKHPEYKNFVYCDSLYDQRNFELSKLELKNATKYVAEPYQQFYNDRAAAIDGTIEECIGEPAGQCLLQLNPIIQKMYEGRDEENEAEHGLNEKPIDECDHADMVSIDSLKMAKEDQFKHKLAHARRDLTQKIIEQKIFNRTADDILYLRLLENDPRMVLPQIVDGAKKLRSIINNVNQQNQSYLTLLRTAQPMYVRKRRAEPDPIKQEKVRQNHLFRVQYQTRRDTFHILDKAQQLRKGKKIRSLVKHVEDVMTNYYGIKTARLMPRMREIMDELYNIVALTYSDKFTVPDNYWDISPYNRIHILLDATAPHSRSSKRVDYKFGDRSSYCPNDDPVTDVASRKYKKNLNYFELRIERSKYHSEKCYLYHQLSVVHLDMGKVDESRLVAQKLINEGMFCRHNLWTFIGFVAMAKADLVQYNGAKDSPALKKARHYALDLGNMKLLHFIDICIRVDGLSLTLGHLKMPKMLRTNRVGLFQQLSD